MTKKRRVVRTYARGGEPWQQKFWAQGLDKPIRKLKTRRHRQREHRTEFPLSGTYDCYDEKATYHWGIWVRQGIRRQIYRTRRDDGTV